MLKLLIIPSLLIASIASTKSGCPCKKFPFIEGAEFGHMTITVFDEKPVNRIQGRITDRLDRSVSNAKVYVWRWPRNVSDEYFPAGDRNFDEYKNRLAACETGEDGRFCFKGLPSGKYKVCAHGSNFNSTCALVRLKTKSKRTGFDIILEAGT
jgi:protocatechuate 3,4-dioxygenase beta subunit